MNKNNEQKKTRKKEEEMKELVIARLKTMSSDKKLSIGSAGDFTRDELIEEVEKGTNIGKEIIEMQLNFIRSMPSLLKKYDAHH